MLEMTSNEEEELLHQLEDDYTDLTELIINLRAESH